MLSDETLTYVVIAIVIIIPSLIVIYSMSKRGKKELEEEKVETEAKSLPFKITKTIPSDKATQAKDELRLLELERGILSDAIRRLYEAHAEGKITEEEREKLAETYKSRMLAVKDHISNDESVIALHELEAIQEDLIKLFSERFDELNAKTEELRAKVEVTPIKEITLPIITSPVPVKQEAIVETKKEVKGRKRRTGTKKSGRKTAAEEKIEKIRAEVEDILDRLGQMEIET